MNNCYVVLGLFLSLTFSQQTISVSHESISVRRDLMEQKNDDPSSYIRYNIEDYLDQTRQGGDTYNDATVISSLPYYTSGTTDGYSDDYDEACPYSGSTSPDVVYSFSPSYDMVINIDMCGEGSYYDTKVYIRDEGEALVDCNDDACNNSHQSYLSELTNISLFQGELYYIIVDGYGGESGEYELNITEEGGPPPPVPDNDDCTDAEVVSGSSPVTLSGTTVGATVDCPSLLNWNAVWYEIPVPDEPSDIEIHVESSQALTNAGIIIMDDCNCDDYIAGEFEWNAGAGLLDLFFENVSVSGGTILFPLMIEPQADFDVTFNFESTEEPPSADFTTTITATDDLGSIPPFELTIGTSPDATVGYDEGLDVYAPPPPPPPSWDAALFNMEISDRFFADYRPTTPEGGTTVWAIDFQAEQGSDEYTLTWDSNTLGDGNFTLTDPFGGSMFSVSMNNVNSATVSTTFNRVLITHSYHSFDFSTTMTATDDLGTDSFELTIGTSSNATDGYDEGLDIYAPPSPPPPAWDAALYNMEISDRFYADYRPTTPMEGNTVWAIDFQAEQGSDEYILTWDPNSLGDGNFILTDPFGGSMLSVDMKNNESAIISATFNRVLITHAYYSFDFLTVLTATDDAGSEPFELSIGTIQNATDGYDDGLDVYAPPAPPPPSWDAALYNQIVNDRFYTDIRPTTPDQGSTVWAVDFQGDVGTENYILSWDSSSLGDGNFTLTDAFGGTLLSIDMNEVSQAEIPAAFNRLLITQSLFTLDFAVILVATDNVNFPVDLIFGTSADASDGYDSGMDVYAPPPPPPPAWDAALYNPIVNDRFYVDIRPTTPEDGFTEWAVDFQADEGSEEINLSWNVDALGDGSFTLTDAFGGMFFSVNMSSTNNYSFPISFTRVFIRHSFTSDIEVSYMDGWNMVGLPLAVVDSSYDIIFPAGEPNTLYAYDNGYSLETALDLGMGYLLRMSGENVTTISGTPFNSVTVSINQGWNIISGISSPIDIDIVNAEDIIVASTVYGYGSNGYFPPDAIEPGYGYWARAYYEGELTLNAGTNRTGKKDEINRSLMNRLDIVFSNGISKSLYFGESLTADEQLQFSLPPRFEGMVLDVRFDGDWSHSENGSTIQLIGLKDPFLIYYSISEKPVDEKWILDFDGNQTVLDSFGEIGFEEIPSTIHLKKESELPQIFSLGTNFPNPFNGMTIIPFELEKTSNISLKVYDVSGRLVNELVTGEKPAGIYHIEWDGKNLLGMNVSSGMYIYSLQSGEHKIFDKLLYLK